MVTPGMGYRRKGERGVLSAEPPDPDGRNGSPYYTHFLLSPPLSCLKVRRRQRSFTKGLNVDSKKGIPMGPPPPPTPRGSCGQPRTSLCPGAYRHMLQGTAVASVD